MIFSPEGSPPVSLCSWPSCLQVINSLFMLNVWSQYLHKCDFIANIQYKIGIFGYNPFIFENIWRKAGGTQVQLKYINKNVLMILQMGTHYCAWTEWWPWWSVSQRKDQFAFWVKKTFLVKFGWDFHLLDVFGNFILSHTFLFTFFCFYSKKGDKLNFFLVVVFFYFILFFLFLQT